MRELRAPDTGQRTMRWQPVVSGMLALLLVSMLAAAAVLAAKPGTVAAQSNTLDTATLAPASSAMYVSVSLDQNSAQYKQATELFTRLGVADPIQSALEDLTKESGPDAAQQVQPFLGGELGFVITDFSALAGAANSMGASSMTGLTGGMSGAMMATPMAAQLGSVSGFAVVLKPSDPAAAWTNAQQALENQASDNGVSVNETTYNGVTIKSVETGGSSTSSNVAMAQVNDFVIVGTTANDLQPIIDTAKGKTDALAKAADFTKVQQDLRPDYLAFGYVNGAAVAQAEAAGANTSTMASLEAMLGPAATAAAGTSGFVVWADDNGFRFDTVSLPAAGQTSPVTKNFEPALPAKVPADTMIFTDGYDLGKNPALLALALAAAEGVTGQSTEGTPPAGMTADQFADQVFAQSAQALGFNLKTDFLDQLQGEYGLALSVTNLDPSGVNFVLVSGSADAAKLNDALSKISLLISAGAQGAATVSTKDVSGSQINVASFEYSGMPLQFEYGVVNNQFVLGFGTSVEQYVAGTSNNLAADPQFQQVMATLPNQRNSLLYINVKGIAAVVQPFLAMMTGSSMGSMGMMGMATPGAAEMASPTAMGSSMQALSAIQAIAAVGYEKDGLNYSSSIIYIPAK